MKIIGIDPGYAIVGFGVLNYEKTKFSVIDYGAITTPAEMDFKLRLKEIYSDLNEVIAKHKPTHMAVERLYFTTNQKTAIDVSQARGVIILAAVQNNIELFEYTPLQVKLSVVGYGKAIKSQVQEMTAKILGLAKSPKPDDVADALAIAICHAHSYNSQLHSLY